MLSTKNMLSLLTLAPRLSYSFPALFPASDILIFVPTYEWSEVPENASVPAGLEVRLVLHKEGGHHQPRLARIPPTWRLQTWLEEEHFFARVDVSRHTPIVDIETAMRAQAIEHRAARRSRHGSGHVQAEDCFLELLSNGERLRVSATAESSGLFGMQRTLVTHLTCHGDGR